MNRILSKKGKLRSGVLVIVAFLMSVLPVAGEEINNIKREQIGEVLGKPIYRDQIKTGDFISVKSEILRLFGQPLIINYRKEHKTEITPTEKEILFATENFKKMHLKKIQNKTPALRAKLKVIEEKLKKKDLTQDEKNKYKDEKEEIKLELKPLGRFFAIFMLDNWKFQRHLYDNYGGGRILWQQAGLEAYDATRKWLEEIEKKGAFKINDPKLRTKFYKYWTSQTNSPFLTNDKERIRTEFLEPEWVQKRVKE